MAFVNAAGAAGALRPRPRAPQTCRARAHCAPRCCAAPPGRPAAPGAVPSPPSPPGGDAGKTSEAAAEAKAEAGAEAAEAVAEAAEAAEPGARAPRVDRNINIYDGDQDDIDRSNSTFGQYNKLSEADTFLGSYVSLDGLGKEGPLEVFYRSVAPPVDNNPSDAVLLLSGLPASSYSWRDVLPEVARETGVRALAPDWLGFGLSDKPSPGFVWPYTTDAYVASLDAFLDALGVERVRCMVVQGWLATAGLVWALRNSARVDAVYVVNAPLPGAAPRMPFALAKWGLPGILGDAFAQDSLSVEQAIEGGGKYKLAIADCEVYRRPQMLSGDAGFSLAAATRGLAMKATFAELAGFRDWSKPIGVAWGVDDKYLKLSVAETFVKDVCPQAELTTVEGAGHYCQEDFPERLAEKIISFIRRLPEDSS